MTALSNGTGTEISFQGRLAQMQIAVSVLDDDGTILRITRSQVVFRHGDWGLFAALMMLVLVVCIYLSFALARRIVTPINQISKAAQAIIDGNYNVNLRIDGYAELNQLLRTLQSMNTRLQETCLLYTSCGRGSSSTTSGWWCTLRASLRTRAWAWRT